MTYRSGLAGRRRRRRRRARTHAQENGGPSLDRCPPSRIEQPSTAIWTCGIASGIGHRASHRLSVLSEIRAMGLGRDTAASSTGSTVYLTRCGLDLLHRPHVGARTGRRHVARQGRDHARRDAASATFFFAMPSARFPPWQRCAPGPGGTSLRAHPVRPHTLSIVGDGARGRAKRNTRTGVPESVSLQRKGEKMSLGRRAVTFASEACGAVRARASRRIYAASQRSFGQDEEALL